MPNKNYDFTLEHSFHGEFWQDINDNQGRFSAKIEYTPYNGLFLDYCISDSKSPTSCKRLYGILNSGVPCTLIGDFDFNKGGLTWGNGVRVLTGQHHFQILIFNGFYDENDSIEYCNLALHGMQEFMHPQGFITQLKHSLNPLLTAQSKDWKIDIINTATFGMVGDGLINVVDCNNEAALEKFNEDFTSTKTAFPSAIFSLRKNLRFYFRYTSSNPLDIRSNIHELMKMSGLFSILMDKPVIPEELHIKFVKDTKSHPCLFSNGMEQRTIDLALTEISHHLLPLNWKQLNIATILANWFTIGDNFTSLSVTYLNETGYRTLHQAHADIILYATQLESINNSLGGKSSTKYTGPIDKYAPNIIKGKLEAIFKIFNSNSLGKNIADLRNELAHVGRPKILMAQMKINDYVEIGLCLKVVVTSHLLSCLGLSDAQIERYQQRVTN